MRDWYILIIGVLAILALVGGPPIAERLLRSPPPEQQATETTEGGANEAIATAQQPQQAQQAQQPSLAQKPAPPTTQNVPATAAAPGSPAAAVTQTAAAAAANAGQAAHQAPPRTEPLSRPGFGGDAVAGRQVFRKCQACHSTQAGKNLLGPTLAGVIGRKAGSVSGYDYSQAMRQANITWDIGTLDAYLADPQKIVPGNKMPFPGLKTEQERKDVIAYLASAGGSASPAAATAGAPKQAQAAPPPILPQHAKPAPSQAREHGHEHQEREAQQGRSQAPSAQTQQQQAARTAPAAPVSYLPEARYTLRSGIADGRMVYIGVGGAIDGKVNPVLTAVAGQIVQITLLNGEGATHDIVFPDQKATSPRVTGKGSSTTLAFRAGKAGDFIYYCSVPGHRLAGMEGQFIVLASPPAPTVVEADISREPTDLPPAIGKRPPQTVRVDLLSVEFEGRLAEGTTFGYWTFNGKVPGPFIRVRVGDTIDIHLKNSADSTMIHSIDFHAATGPGGGAAALQVNPGEEKSMTLKALVPGLYVYHCATPMVAAHIANGMYGLILVEPEGGLPKVDHEFYVMQGEIYTAAAFGQHGSQEFSVEKLLDERPEYFVFNGSVGAISKLHPLQAKVGDAVRIFFGNAGPNFTSSFHIIGEIFDDVHLLGGLESPPLKGIQTVTVPPGGTVITEFKLDVQGNYTLVDHALSRAERGLVGILHVEGPPNTDIYNGTVGPEGGH
jgi:nitrite reductase (NO-forming)